MDEVNASNAGFSFPSLTHSVMELPTKIARMDEVNASNAGFSFPSLTHSVMELETQALDSVGIGVHRSKRQVALVGVSYGK
jgi:hypothetical protein